MLLPIALNFCGSLKFSIISSSDITNPSSAFNLYILQIVRKNYSIATELVS